jgi:hypothetical protein
MPGSSELDSLNSVKYLDLRELFEPKDNSLRLVADEAVENRSRTVRLDLPGLESVLKDSWPIESTEECKRFELSWQHVVAYLATEECVGSCGSHGDESYTGKLLRVYTKSHFLEHIAQDTGGHTRPIQHYKLICLNHLVDVACYAAPEIRLLGPDSSQSLRIH